MSSLSGRSAIVTGAGGGICLEFARLLLQHGVNVVLADLVLRPEAEECVQKYKDKPVAIFQKTDVTSWDDLTNLFKKAETEFGVVDIVCPGAGIFEPSISNFWIPPGSDESKDDPSGGRYKTLDVNITHPIRVTQMAIAHFLASKSSATAAHKKVVVHTVSAASEMAFLPVPMYVATKWALAGFIHSLADLDEGADIRVMGVAPGIVKTPLWLEAKEKQPLIHKDGKILEDWTTPEHIAEIMLGMVLEEEMVSIDDDARVDIKGGLVLEVGAQHVRPIPIWHNRGPRSDMPGMGSTLNREDQQAEVWERLKKTGWGQF